MVVVAVWTPRSVSEVGNLAPPSTPSVRCQTALPSPPFPQRIKPPQHPSAMVRRGAVTVGPAVNEMGVYGIFLSDGRDVLHNEPAGHLLRTKVGFLALALLSCP